MIFGTVLGITPAMDRDVCADAVGPPNRIEQPDKPAVAGARNASVCPPSNGMTLFCTELHADAGGDALAALFKPFEATVEVRVLRDKATGKSKGTAYINFGAPAPAIAALRKLDGTNGPCGAPLKLQFAKTDGGNRRSSQNDTTAPTQQKALRTVRVALPCGVTHRQVEGAIAGFAAIEGTTYADAGVDALLATAEEAQAVVRALHGYLLAGASELLDVRLISDVAVGTVRASRRGGGRDRPVRAVRQHDTPPLPLPRPAAAYSAPSGAGMPMHYSLAGLPPSAALAIGAAGYATPLLPPGYAMPPQYGFTAYPPGFAAPPMLPCQLASSVPYLTLPPPPPPLTAHVWAVPR
jgi:hypothetical protein